MPQPKTPEEAQLRQLAAQLPRERARFEMEVEATCLEITHIAKDVSSALGEVSIDELKDAMVREFEKRLKS